MFSIELSTAEQRTIAGVPGAPFQMARWLKHFHGERYAHIGWLDHQPGSPVGEVLNKYGFIRVPRLELNALRTLLRTYGPVLLRGRFAHLAQNRTQVPIPEMRLWQVRRYEEADHAVLLNGYWDGFHPRLLYRDAQHPQCQLVVALDRVRERMDLDFGLFYLNCAAFPKPCVHVTTATGSAPPQKESTGS